MSSPSERIREARERLGLSPHAVAQGAGLNYDWYFDVEHDDGEVTSNLSLDSLIAIAAALWLTPLGILEGPDFPQPAERVSLAELAELAMRRMEETELPLEAFSERVGWEMAPVFADPESIRGYTVDALRDICREVGVDWHAAIPQSPRGSGG